MNHHVCKPEYARWSMECVPGKGWRLVDPDGRPQSAFYGAGDRAQSALDAAQARADAARKRAVRPCLCCQKPFESEGIHNRLCSICRHREGSCDPYGLAPRSGRAK